MKMFFVSMAVIGLLFSVNAQASAEAKIALVDMARVVSNYDKAKAVQADLKVNQAAIRKMLANAKKDIREIDDEEKKKEMQKKLAKNIMAKNKSFKEDFAEKWQEVQEKVLLTIKSVADRQKYDLVVDKTSVIAGGEDITQNVIDELKK